jgi:hypothetical protein
MTTIKSILHGTASLFVLGIYIVMMLFAFMYGALVNLLADD